MVDLRIETHNISSTTDAKNESLFSSGRDRSQGVKKTVQKALSKYMKSFQVD